MLNRFDIKDKTVIEMYKDGLTTGDIAEKLKCSKTLVNSRLRKNKIAFRTNKDYKQKKFNETFFDKIDTKEKAYWLGFLYADGCNNENINKISIALHQKDRDILELFKKHINFEGNIYFYSIKRTTYTENRVQMGLTSEHFSKRLAEIGCFAKKSLKTRMPSQQIINNSELMWHFIRGVFDGDGCMGENKYSISFTSGKTFAYELAAFFKKNNIESCYFYKGVSYSKRCMACNVTNVVEYIKLCSKMYANSEGLRMERKYKLYINNKNRFLQKYVDFKNLLRNLNILDDAELLEPKIQDFKKITHFIGHVFDKNFIQEKSEKIKETA